MSRSVVNCLSVFSLPSPACFTSALSSSRRLAQWWPHLPWYIVLPVMAKLTAVWAGALGSIHKLVNVLILWAAGAWQVGCYLHWLYNIALCSTGTMLHPTHGIPACNTPAYPLPQELKQPGSTQTEPISLCPACITVPCIAQPGLTFPAPWCLRY